MTTGKTVQALNTLKNLLHQRLVESKWLSKEIHAKTETLSKMKEENTAIAADVVAERRTRKKLSQNTADTREMPNVDHYIEQKADNYRLQQEVRNWERKVEIAIMDTRRARVEATRLL